MPRLATPAQWMGSARARKLQKTLAAARASGRNAIGASLDELQREGNRRDGRPLVRRRPVGRERSRWSAARQKQNGDVTARPANSANDGPQIRRPQRCGAGVSLASAASAAPAPRTLERLRTPVRRYLGASTQVMRLPCWLGGASTLPTSSRLWITWRMTRWPSSMWASSRPRNTTETITLSLCVRNSRA